jgi:NADH-quinone oxidoreductase subunit L|tara:strand:- start:258 stop:2111 length:1854 start_codon:yes stop_codon:yes gene_type:complete
MLDLVWLVPIFPLAGFLILFTTIGKLPQPIAAAVGAGSVGLAAVVAFSADYVFLADGMSPLTVTLYTWMNVGDFSPGLSFYVDGLTLIMMFVITGVGFLIHVYSTTNRAVFIDDEHHSRFFAYMNLFVCAMLLLVMGDNLLLLYMGWEGVGLCSYLLIGFWHDDPANGAAARKAFVVTRIGDTAMALGLFLLFLNFRTLEIQPLMAKASGTWVLGSPTLAAFLILGGAVGKSAQLPLQTWLPDAMAGPTPVSALIHAATMVTAGVYLIARTHELFLLAPVAQTAVALVGVITLLMAACTALVQTDIKRILAFSTISQIGYMFLALGVSAWSSGIFHLMTHAFFKALLFLGAGAVIFSLHHEHNILKMGGLRKRLPVAFWSFLIGSAALAAFPFTSGFYSKEPILMQAFEVSPWLWAGGLLGAFITAIYSFRLVFIVFFGEMRTEPIEPTGLSGTPWAMAIPLLILCVLAITGGWWGEPQVAAVFPEVSGEHHAGATAYITSGVPLVGIVLAYLIFLDGRLKVTALTESSLGKVLHDFWFSHWAMDWLYNALFVSPFKWVTAFNKKDILVDSIYDGTAATAAYVHTLLSQTQTGVLRFYAASMALGLVVLVAVVLGLT